MSGKDANIGTDQSPYKDNGSSPGERRGGRKKGVVNKRTQEVIDKVMQACEARDIDDPINFQIALMAGDDPREQSYLLELLTETFELYDEDLEFFDMPSRDQWDHITRHIQEFYKFRPVPIEVSERAGARILEYTCPKLKSVTVETTGGAIATTEPLTEEEAKLFWKTFNEEF